MTEDEAIAALEALQRDRDQQRQDLDRLRREFDQLSQKLRYPGTKFLVDLEYKLVYDATLTATASTQTVSAVIETLPGALHAVYALSAYASGSDTPKVITDGAIIVGPTDAVTVALQRQRTSSPRTIAVKVILYNSAVTDYDIAIRVWRRLGMGS